MRGAIENSHTDRHRPAEDTDIVVWHTVGMPQMTRAEDLPAITVVWRGFKLRPSNFFDRNPALDLRTVFSETVSRS